MPTEEGWLHLAAVLDLATRKVVGWAMRDHTRPAEGVMALWSEATEIDISVLQKDSALKRPERAMSRKSGITRRTLCCINTVGIASLACSKLVNACVASCLMKNSDENDWHVLLDNYWISKIIGCERELLKPSKTDKPIIFPDEGCAQNPYAFGTLLYDDRRCVFRLWYQSYNRSERPQTAVLYAESKDGWHWTFPSEGRIACSLAGTNNVVMGPHGEGDLYSPSVVEDAREREPLRRFKMVYSDYIGGKDPYVNGGVCVAFSPDGLSWSPYHGNPVLSFRRSENAMSDVVDIYHDSVTEQYELYGKGWADWRAASRGMRPRFRTVVRSVSSDFINWSEPEVIVRHRFDIEDPQSYGMPVFRAGDLRIGLLRSYKLPGNGKIDIRLMASRDGRTWSYPAGFKSYVENGAPDSFDRGMIMTTPAITVGDTHYIAYGGWSGPHEDKNRRASIGLLTTPRHRFASLSGGAFDTVLLANAGATLHVNVDAAPDRPMVVELIDAAGQPLPGYSRAESRAVIVDNVNEVVKFEKRASLPRAPFAIRFHLGRARLYAFNAGAALAPANSSSD